MIRGIVTSAEDRKGKNTILDASGRADETIEGRELIQQSGFKSIPKEGDEVLFIKVGNLILAIATASGDAPELEVGESSMFKDAKNYIKIDKDGNVFIANEGKIYLGDENTLPLNPLAGVVTGQNLDPVTGVPFPDHSLKVFASKGGL